MVFQDIPLEEIDFANESYRISEELYCRHLADSLRAVGQLNPICVLDTSPQKLVVCGFRRLAALKRLGVGRVLVRMLSVVSGAQVEVFNIALWDNLSHRCLNPLEKARVLYKLKNLFGVAEEKLVRFYLPLLDLGSSSKVLNSYLLLNDLHPGLRSCLIEGRLTQASLERLAQRPQKIQSDMAALMNRIRLSASLQKKVLDLLEDLSAISGASLTEPLQMPEIRAAVEDPCLSPFQKGEKVHEVLYRLRYPRLARALERFAARKKLLDLPGSIRITPDPFFESPGLRVEFNADSAKCFREHTAALQEASRSPVVDELFEVG